MKISDKMAGETVVETPQDNTKVDEPVKTDKEVIAEEEAALANEVSHCRVDARSQTKPTRSNINLADFVIKMLPDC